MISQITHVPTVSKRGLISLVVRLRSYFKNSLPSLENKKGVLFQQHILSCYLFSNSLFYLSMTQKFSNIPRKHKVFDKSISLGYFKV